MAQVPLVRTPVAMSDYCHALLRAWKAELGILPTKAAAGVLWAQYMIETGGAACWCWNLGNVKVTQAQVDAGVPFFDLPGTWEMVNGVRVVLRDGDPGRRFRAFASLEEAMLEHFRFLRNRRYKTSWPSVEAGDCLGFAQHLKAAGYFTATAEAYAAGMLPHHRRWMASTVYEDQVQALLAAMEADTDPELPAAEEPTPFPIVHPRIPLDRPALDEDELPTVIGIDDDEPPPAAA